MKKFIIISILAIAGITLFFNAANDRTRPQTSAVVYGLSSDQSYVTVGGTAADTIVVSDTIQYPIYVDHTQKVYPYISLFWDKIGSGNATCTLTFWQSNDGVNYYQVTKGSGAVAYSKTISGTADAYINYSFASDTAVLEGRFLKLRFITSSTASVKAKLTSKIKFNL